MRQAGADTSWSLPETRNKVQSKAGFAKASRHVARAFLSAKNSMIWTFFVAVRASKKTEIWQISFIQGILTVFIAEVNIKFPSPLNFAFVWRGRDDGPMVNVVAPMKIWLALATMGCALLLSTIAPILLSKLVCSNLTPPCASSNDD